jgi:phosphoglycolate phosphatase
MLVDNQLVKRLQTGAIRGIIFDFDGTLLDIREPLQRSIEEVYQAKNINADISSTIEEIGALMETIQGYPLPKILLESYEMFKYITSLKSLSFFKKLEIAIKIFTKYLTYAKEAPLFPNTVEILKKIKKSFDLFIVSHNQTRNVNEHLEKENIKSFFKGIYGADELPALKPDPKALTPIFNSYKSSKLKEFIMVGDMPSDIEVGREAGIWTVAIASGVSSKQTLSEFKPDILVESLDEFLNIIEKKVSNANTQKSLKIKS